MSRRVLYLLAIAGFYFLSQQFADTNTGSYDGPQFDRDVRVEEARNNGASNEPRLIDNTQARGKGKVVRILSDDIAGSRHQRFILKFPSGRTVLVAHNIDLAPRVANLRIGDTIEFHGEFEFNPEGGVIHWTHRDQNGSHAHGWLRHAGKLYQ